MGKLRGERDTESDTAIASASTTTDADADADAGVVVARVRGRGESASVGDEHVGDARTAGNRVKERGRLQERQRTAAAAAAAATAATAATAVAGVHCWLWREGSAETAAATGREKKRKKLGGKCRMGVRSFELGARGKEGVGCPLERKVAAGRMGILMIRQVHTQR
jgi:hypothetical protein